ncbi:MAG: hypothetical protein ACREJO_08230 [Phycisphaerales bacterium]
MIPATGATSITLTLQGRAIFNGAFPADTANSLYGDFGVFSMGFGPNGAAQPSTISRSDPSVIIRRGDWGVYQVANDGGDPSPTPFMRGAAPGVYDAATFSFSRGMRFLFPIQVPENPPFPNAPGPVFPVDGIALANGEWNTAGNMTSFNLLRGDFQSTTPQARNLMDPAGGPAWMDLYRIQIDTLTPVILGAGGFTVDFNGWLRAAGQSSLVGGNWTMTGGAAPPSSAAIGFIAVPTPSAVALLALAAVATRRRRA